MNVWVALAAPDHAHHGRAAKYWNSEAFERVAFCRVTALGFVRVSSTKAALGDQALSVQDAWRGYQRFKEMQETIFMHEPANCESVLEELSMANTFRRDMWTDAYLAAFAMTGGLRLVTFDSDLKRFRGLHLLRLES